MRATQAVQHRTPLPWLRPAVFVGSLVPLAAIVARAARGELGPSPVAEALNQLGLLALVFLVASLACTPLKTVFDVTWGLRLRRMLGLFAFFYALLHAGFYVGVDQHLDLHAIVADVVKRRFIQVGGATLIILVALALTSTQGAIRRLGFVPWKRLHRLSYVAASLAIVHFFWRVKKDVREPLVYAAVLVVLLVVRAVPAMVATLRAHLPARRDDVSPVATGPGRTVSSASRLVAIGLIGGWAIIVPLALLGVVARERPSKVLNAGAPTAVCVEAPGASVVPGSLLVIHGRGPYCGW